MGWKANCTILNPKLQVDDIKLIRALGFEGVRKEDSYLDSELYTENNFAIGEFENTKIICHPTLTLEGIGTNDNSKFEYALIKLFSSTYILSFGLNGVMNIYGYALIDGFRKVRVNSGSSNGKLYEYGQRTVEENNRFKNYVFDEKRNKYFQNGNSYKEDELGEELVFALTKRFFGKPLNELELEKVVMRVYELEKQKDNGTTRFLRKIGLQ